jgi:hypothetical protein
MASILISYACLMCYRPPMPESTATARHEARTARILGKMAKRVSPPRPARREKTGGEEILWWLKANPSPEALERLKQAMRAGIADMTCHRKTYCAEPL